MSEYVQYGKFTVRLVLADDEWILKVYKHDSDDIRYDVKASGPGEVNVRFEMTRTPIGKWLLIGDWLPPSIKNNAQQIGRTIFHS